MLHAAATNLVQRLETTIHPLFVVEALVAIDWHKTLANGEVIRTAPCPLLTVKSGHVGRARTKDTGEVCAAV